MPCVAVASDASKRAVAASPRRLRSTPRAQFLALAARHFGRSSPLRITSSPLAELDPLPVGAADRRDLATILATSERQVVLSRARRGQRWARPSAAAPFLQGQLDETHSGATDILRITPSARSTD